MDENIEQNIEYDTELLKRIECGVEHRIEENGIWNKIQN